ncbi:phage major capsid protein [Lacrimispora sp. 210928-DFI.3.58]|uniref:phage major capsid protein n=1 Tax=Lacrimispora sp. 210928-DFI.3.58 TaxID=2883214 RepID=UPI001D090FF5|nr:phage major capsid protein [Lacrimispora sp. 210928-DFI.3.58]MCB7321098.1 phage major capsid protein [Lacrimispora sp. 210928-DFI.3.58]
MYKIISGRELPLNVMNLQLFAGTADSIDRTGAEALIPEQTSREIIQGVTEQSTVLSMGRKLPNMSSNRTVMPVLDMLPVAYFVNGDTGTKKTTKMAWDKKKIYAEEIAVIVPIPEAVLDDADYDIWGEVRPRLVEAFGKVIDSAIFFGVDKPDNWRDDIHATATAAGAVVTATSNLYKDIMGTNGVIAKIEKSGYMPTGYVADIAMRAELRELTDNNGRPIFKTDLQSSTQYSLDGNRMIFPRNGSWEATKAKLIAGDFDQLVYSMRQDITFKLFDQGVVQDPSTGEIVYNLMQNDMVAMRAVMRLGWEIPNPINSLETDKIKRCPFAVYAPAVGSGS